ncbi:hypothetical protein CCR75_004743 [Bremia lactucae]|uniref:Uncharacterized protein n=1 Tax=Bremia lactucae TaxID=4779 RepID=A0A976IJX3_BRELC|nr:hypothetical protein CCR75_004743 [Bremia lactucae]
MVVAPDLPAEPQHEPAPVDSMLEREPAAASLNQQTTPPETGELLGRVATEISLAFQSSLVQTSVEIMVSNLARFLGYAELFGPFVATSNGGLLKSPPC